MNDALVPLAVGVSTATLCAALVPASRTLARRFGILDEPGIRKIHSVPTPRLGGIAVYLSFVVVVLAGYLLTPAIAALPMMQELASRPASILREAYRVESKLMALLAGSTIAFGVGLLDDVFGARFRVAAKAAGQILAAAVLIAAGVRTSFMPYEWMNVTVTLLWLVGMTNAFNLLDNMDGLSAGVALVASGVFLVTAWSLGELFIALLLAAFMGSLIGFLFYNFHPASVFLGDCGSLFIGYVMGALTLLERYVSHASSNLFPVLMPVVVLAVPLVDTATVIVIRLREGRPIYVGDSCHLSHRLRALGMSTRKAVLFLYLMTFSLGLGATSLTNATVFQAAGVLLQSSGFVALMLVLLFWSRRSVPSASGAVEKVAS